MMVVNCEKYVIMENNKREMIPNEGGKTMKKLFAVALALVMLLSVAAFAEAANYTGIWYLNEIDFGGTKLAPAAMGMDMTFELKDDGTVVATSPNEEGAMEETNGSWTLEGEALTVTIDDDPMVFSLVDGNLVADSGDGMAMTFGREKVEAEVYVPAEPKADAAEADYAGSWVATQLDMDGMFINPALLGMDTTAVIEGTTITLNGAFLFDNEAFEAELKDGALVYAAANPDEVMVSAISVQALEDGALKLVIGEAENAMCLYLEKAE